MNNTRVEDAIDSLKLTTIRRFSKTPLDDNGDDIAYWADKVCAITGDPKDHKTAYRLLQERLDAIIVKRKMLGDFTSYDEAVAPPNRPKGLGPEHACATPTTCKVAPQWWEDHCHIYPLLVAYKTAGNTRSSDIYPQLADYYRPVARGVLRRFRSQVDSEEIASYSVRALHACIESYDPKRKVPMQAYLRAQLGRRIVDRLRSEGIFTRSEGALVSAMQELLPNYAAGDPISQADIVVLADRFGTNKESVERTILAYARKVRTLRIDFASTDLDDPYLQIPYDGQESIEAIEDRMIANEDARVGVEILSHHLEEENKALLIAWFSSEPGLPNPELDSLLSQIGVSKQEASKRVTRLVSDLRARAKNLTGAPSLTHPNAQHEFSKAVTAGAAAMRDLLPV